MSQHDADARAVVSHFQRMLGADGSALELQSVDGDLLTVSYRPGNCATCELAPEDLLGMMAELLARRRSALTRVALG